MVPDTVVLNEDGFVFVHPLAVEDKLSKLLELVSEAVKSVTGLKDGTFLTLVITTVKLLVPWVKAIKMLGGTRVQEDEVDGVQTADESPISEGNVTVSVPVGAKDGTMRSRVIEMVSLLR